MMITKTTRRSALQGALLGAGCFGLRALATGLPASFLLQAGSARAAELPACAGDERAQFLILSVSGDGDPLNANVPGTYDDPGIVHPDAARAPAMAKAPLQLGSNSTTAAQAWSVLPDWVLDRTSFFHMATMTTIHPDMPKVLKLMGAVAGQEMLPSLVARNLASCLGTVQAAPVSLLGTARPEFITAEGRVIPNLNTLALRDILVHPDSPLTRLAQLRDQSMDLLHARLKTSGSPAQRSFMDNLAISRAQARGISDTLVNNLAAVQDNDVSGQILGAATLIAMNVTPVVVIRVPFGGDNHGDPQLINETEQTQSGIDAIGALMQTLRQYQLEDRVTFATLNVFGRTLQQLGTSGRHHWADHQVSLLIGKTVRAGVVGGVVPGPLQDYTALPIDSTTGLGTPDGDVSVPQTLGSFGKTLASAVGVSKDIVERDIGQGKVISAALM
jgi:hypothetical protein